MLKPYGCFTREFAYENNSLSDVCCGILLTKRIFEGSAIEAFTGTHYRSYDGIGWRLDQYGQKERHSVKGRIIIDTIGWNRYQPNSAVFVSALNSSGLNKSVLGTRTLFLPSLEEALDSVSGDFGGMPLDGMSLSIHLVSGTVCTIVYQEARTEFERTIDH